MKPKRFLIVLVILLMLFLFGCTGTTIKYNVSFSGSTLFGYQEDETGGINHCAQTIIRSREELTELCEQWNNPAFKEETASDELCQTIRSYDETFFEQNALIVYSSWQWNKALDPKVKKITVKESQLTVHIGLKKLNVNYDVAEIFTFLIEVKKDSVENVSKIITKEEYGAV